MTARGRSYNTYDDFRDGSYHPIITSCLNLTQFSHYKIPENGSNEPNISRSPSPSVNQYSGYSQYSCMTPTSQLSASRTQASLTPTISRTLTSRTPTSRTPTSRTPTSRTPTSMTPSYSVTPTYTSITPSYNSDNDTDYDDQYRTRSATYFSDTDNFTHTRYSGILLTSRQKFNLL